MRAPPKVFFSGVGWQRGGSALLFSLFFAANVQRAARRGSVPLTYRYTRITGGRPAVKASGLWNLRLVQRGKKAPGGQSRTYQGLGPFSSKAISQTPFGGAADTTQMQPF
jgi:hypothetical protein